MNDGSVYNSCEGDVKQDGWNLYAACYAMTCGFQHLVNMFYFCLGFVHKLFLLLLYANLPDAFFKKGFYGLAVCLIYQIRV